MKVYVVTHGIYHEDATNIEGVFLSMESAIRCADELIDDGEWNEDGTGKASKYCYAQIEEWLVEK